MILQEQDLMFFFNLKVPYSEVSVVAFTGEICKSLKWSLHSVENPSSSSSVGRVRSLSAFPL